jgi:hypothetical protein
MATKVNQKYFKWLSTLSTEEAWKRIIEDATVGMAVDPQKCQRSRAIVPQKKLFNRSSKTFSSTSAV